MSNNDKFEKEAKKLQANLAKRKLQAKKKEELKNKKKISETT